jgi:two-component system, NarL family, sensor histidine kinase DegS
MQLHQNEYNFKRGSNGFNRLGTWYILALSIIAFVAIIGQLLIQSHLHTQLSDSRVVNVAGKQRMLSQKIAKSVLGLREGQSAGERKAILRELKESFFLWKESQDGLLDGNDSLRLPGDNSADIVELFQQVAGHFNSMSGSTLQLIDALESEPEVPYSALHGGIEQILLHEKPFLQGMEKIVNQYDAEAKSKVFSLQTMEFIVLAISLLVILLEVLFIFRPTTRQVSNTISELIASEKNARRLSGEIGALYSSLEKTYEQMAIVNQPVENPRLLAKADRGGNVTFISESFAEISGLHRVKSSTRLSDLFPGLSGPDDWMDNVVGVVSEGKPWQGELRFKKAAKRDCWFEIVITPVYNEHDEIEELLMLGSDISLRKAAEQNMNQKNRAEIEKKINQQKFRSVLILEGQEEERKRIAMDIHDGIGQMLTSLKYQIESIDLTQDTRAREKISEIDQLIKEIIKEVRKVTFDLKPTVLGDYGLQAGLNVFIREIGKLTGIDLQYRTSGQVPRLPQKIENNIFRIIQEAINNAIKYSGAEQISVSLKQIESDLMITVRDEGKGFDTKIVGARTSNLESGRGFFNMYERTEYVNGNLEIQSEKGQGTTVKLTVPLHSIVRTE